MQPCAMQRAKRHAMPSLLGLVSHACKSAMRLPGPLIYLAWLEANARMATEESVQAEELQEAVGPSEVRHWGAAGTSACQYQIVGVLVERWDCRISCRQQIQPPPGPRRRRRRCLVPIPSLSLPGCERTHAHRQSELTLIGPSVTEAYECSVPFVLFACCLQEPTQAEAHRPLLSFDRTTGSAAGAKHYLLPVRVSCTQNVRLAVARVGRATSPPLALPCCLHRWTTRTTQRKPSTGRYRCE